MTRTIHADQLTEELLDYIADVAISRYGVRDRIDWEDLLFRVEELLEIDLPSQMLDPTIIKIQRYVRAARKEMV